MAMLGEAVLWRLGPCVTIALVRPCVTIALVWPSVAMLSWVRPCVLPVWPAVLVDGRRCSGAAPYVGPPVRGAAPYVGPHVLLNPKP